MKTLSIHEVDPGVELVSFKDTAMFLNLFYPEIVEEILESFTDFTDFDIIAEMADILKLNITAVIEKTKIGILIHGYIHNGGC